MQPLAPPALDRTVRKCLADGGEILYGTQNGVFAVALDASGSSLQINAPEFLFDAKNISDGAPAPDFQRFLVVKSEGEPQTEPLALVVNWTAELERR